MAAGHNVLWSVKTKQQVAKKMQTQLWSDENDKQIREILYKRFSDQSRFFLCFTLFYQNLVDGLDSDRCCAPDRIIEKSISTMF